MNPNTDISTVRQTIRSRETLERERDETITRSVDERREANELTFDTVDMTSDVEKNKEDS